MANKIPTYNNCVFFVKNINPNELMILVDHLKAKINLRYYWLIQRDGCSWWNFIIKSLCIILFLDTKLAINNPEN
jgi:hypothetical protein